MRRKVRMGMVGGGRGAFIGAIHRMAAQLDGQVELVCGAFSSDPNESISSGEALFVQPERCYPTYQQMLLKESAMPDHKRIDFVVIVTPNHLHFDIAKTALEAGFHVLSDKPATRTLEEVLALKAVLGTTDKLYGITHTYVGYPLVRHARHLVQSGELGTVRKVVVEYSQGWLGSAGAEDGKQAQWRLDPETAGLSCCMGDIGVHAAHIAEYVSGEKITEICAELDPVVPGRLLDDDGAVFLRFSNRAKGILMASQVATGEENNLRLRVYGEYASLDWAQQQPNDLLLRYPDKPTVCMRTGVGTLSPSAEQCIRTPAGHPEGYIEAFANLYMRFVEAIRCDDLTYTQPGKFPEIDDAIRGMAFIEGVVNAAKSEQKWHTLTDPTSHEVLS